MGVVTGKKQPKKDGDGGGSRMGGVGCGGNSQEQLGKMKEGGGVGKGPQATGEDRGGAWVEKKSGGSDGGGGGSHGGGGGCGGDEGPQTTGTVLYGSGTKGLKKRFADATK